MLVLNVLILFLKLVSPLKKTKIKISMFSKKPLSRFCHFSDIEQPLKSSKISLKRRRLEMPSRVARTRIY